MKECCQCGCVGETGFVVYCDECYDSQDNELEQELANLKEENDKLNHAIKKLDLIIESDKFEGWSDQYHEMRQVIDSLKESNEKK